MSASLPVLQVEVVLSHEELTQHVGELQDLATVLGRLDPLVTPVFTDTVYKQGVDAKVEGTAGAIEQMVRRHAGTALRERITKGADEYAQKIAYPSDFILSVLTRRSFVESYNALDSDSLKERVERLRGVAGWMLFMLDAHDGLTVTAHSTAKTVNTVLEAESQTTLITQVNPKELSAVDIPLLTTPEAVQNALVQHKLLLPIEADAAWAATNKLNAVATLVSLLNDQGKPTNHSLDDFESWIHKQGSFQRVHMDYLLKIYYRMVLATNDHTQHDREAAIKDINIMLADAYNQGLEPHIIKECARVLNTYVRR